MSIDLRKMRELVFLFLYSFDMGSEVGEDFQSLLMEECKVNEEFVALAEARANKIIQAQKECDQLLEKVSVSYRVERIHSVERNILRLSIYELIIEKEISPAIILSEAKRLAKKFSTEEASFFVQTLLLSLLIIKSSK